MPSGNAQVLRLPEASTVTPKTVIAVGVVLPALAAIAVGLRFYVRIAKTKSVGVDDFLILFALTLTIALGIMIIIGSAVHALAQPTPLGDGPEGFLVVLNDAIIITEKMKWTFNLLQVLILGTIKLSVLFFYRRIFRGKTFDYYSRGMIAIVGTWTIAFFFTVLFECGTKFEYLWSTLLNLLTHCTNDVMYLKAYAISDVITDGLILATPIPIIWRLQMSVGRKVAVCAAFLLGLVAVAAGLARVVIFVSQLADSFSISQGILLITTWMYWSMIELGLSIVAACLPTLRPLLGDWSLQGYYRFLRSYVTSRSRTYSMGRYRSSDLDSEQSKDRGKEMEASSNSSQAGILPPNVARVPTNIYPMKDVEAQAIGSTSRVTARDQFERASHLQ